MLPVSFRASFAESFLRLQASIAFLLSAAILLNGWRGLAVALVLGGIVDVVRYALRKDSAAPWWGIGVLMMAAMAVVAVAGRRVHIPITVHLHAFNSRSPWLSYLDALGDGQLITASVPLLWLSAAGLFLATSNEFSAKTFQILASKDAADKRAEFRVRRRRWTIPALITVMHLFGFSTVLALVFLSVPPKQTPIDLEFAHRFDIVVELALVGCFYGGVVGSIAQACLTRINFDRTANNRPALVQP